MAQFAPFIILVATLLINPHSNCSGENVYCVTPTAMSCSSCPQNYSYSATLSEYAQQAELYFTSNTTMVFLSGGHILDTDITVTSVARLTMSSWGSAAQVVCSGSIGLSFTSKVDFKLYSLALTVHWHSMEQFTLLTMDTTKVKQTY